MNRPVWHTVAQNVPFLPQYCPMSAKKYRAQIKVRDPVTKQDLRDSATFATKREAEAWKVKRRQELLDSAKRGSKGRATLQQALYRYLAEVSPLHKGHAWEAKRIHAFLRDTRLPITLPLTEITTAHLNQWKQARMQEVMAGTVLRDLGLLSSVFGYCCRDWCWMDNNPIAMLRKPPAPRHRDRVITWREARTVLRQLGYRHGKRPASMKQMTAYAFLIALHTGMRAGEIVSAEWAQYHGVWLSLPDTKNSTARDVPLSHNARKLIGRLRGLDEDRLLPIASGTLDATFRKARDSAGLSGFRFHDTRHTAATRVGATVGQPGKLSFPEFCKVFGWRNPKYALVYVNPSASSLAAKL